MTDPDPLDRYFDDFGRRLCRAASAATDSPRPRGRRCFALASALAVGAIALTALALGSNRLDPVAEAQAALAAPGEIIYMKITSTHENRDADTVPPPQTTEQWSTLDPPRWRVVQTLPPPGSPAGTVSNSHGPSRPISGRMETAYGGGEQRQYVAERDTLTVRQGDSDDGPAARLPSFIPAGSGDVETDLRAMLSGGDVTDEGEQQADGRMVRRLVSVNRPRGDRGAEWRLVYDVDPQTYEPIGATVTITIPNPGGDSHTVTTRIHVDEYKRIPLNAATAKLLEIQTTPQTKIIVHTAEELRERERRMREQCRPRPNGDVVCPPSVLQTPRDAP